MLRKLWAVARPTKPTYEQMAVFKNLSHQGSQCVQLASLNQVFDGTKTHRPAALCKRVPTVHVFEYEQE